MNKAITGGDITAAGCSAGNRLDDHVVREFLPTSFKGTSVYLLILKSSLASFWTDVWFFNDCVIY